MADDEKRSYSNIFIANTIYPEAKSIFSFHLEPIEKIKDNCYFVLDTNVLIAPYINGGKDSLLEECQKTYGSLVAEKRLIIPSQVAREFAKVRQDKLAELHQQLTRKMDVKLIEQDRYPLLSSLNELKEASHLVEEINKKIKEYQKTVGRIVSFIREWNWDDPVSMLYHKIFTDETILDIEIKEDDIRKDLHMRQEHDIPPGYKDATKKDEGIGDLLIWHTILEIGKLNNKSVIFVTGDEKADWYKKSEKYPLYPRYELVDEFRRASGGHSFHMIRFSRFLELFGATDEIVKLVEKDEEKSSIIQTNSSIRWLVDIDFILSNLKGQINDFMFTRFFATDSIKDIIQIHLGRIWSYYGSFPLGIPKKLNDYLFNVIDSMVNITNDEIFINGEKSIKEITSLMLELLAYIDTYLNYCKMLYPEINFMNP